MLVIFGLIKTPVFSEVWLAFFMKDKIKNSQLQALIWKRFWCGIRKTTNYIVYKEFFNNFETIIGHFGVPVKCETKPNETKRIQTKRNEIKRNETKFFQNEM